MLSSWQVRATSAATCRQFPRFSTSPDDALHFHEARTLDEHGRPAPQRRVQLADERNLVGIVFSTRAKCRDGVSRQVSDRKQAIDAGGARVLADFAMKCRTPIADLSHIPQDQPFRARRVQDRKSTRLNSSHLGISYAVFCLK